MEEKLYCVECEKEIEKENAFEFDGEYYCEDCYHDNYFVCDDCGEIESKENMYITSRGNNICESCYENDYSTCERCGEIEFVDDMVEVDSDTRYVCYVCQGCADYYYYKCDDCGKYFSSGRGNTVYHDGYEETICDNCLDNGSYCYCEDCGEYYHEDNMTYCEDDDCYYCDGCIENHQSGIICAYHDHDNELEFFGNDKNNTVPYFGVELEIDKGSSNIECAEYTKDQFPYNFIYFEHDGSLDDGYENITQPATLLYHYNLKDTYQEVFKYLSSKGYRSHDTSTCGLHVHFNRNFFEENEDLYITRLLYLTEKFWDNLVKFSRRKLDKLQRWADKYDSTPEKVLEDMKGYRLDRYKAVNLTNDDTIEFRLFRAS